MSLSGLGITVRLDLGSLEVSPSICRKKFHKIGVLPSLNI